MKTKDKIREKLYEIAKHYKRKYGLSTFIDVVNYGDGTYFNYKTNSIFLSFECIQTLIDEFNLNKRTHTKNLEKNLIFALLHELKHAIDFRNDSKGYINENASINRGLYKTDQDYRDNLPLEIRADNFAREEIKKWI